MFYARVEYSFEFRRILEVIKDIVPLVNLKVTGSGVLIEANEACCVIQVRLHLPHTFFSEFKCQGTHTIGVNLKDMHTFIRFAQPEDGLCLEYVEGRTVLNVLLEAAKVPTIYSFSLNLMTVQSPEGMYEELESSGVFEICSKLLHHTCFDLGQVSDLLRISINKLRVKFSVDTEVSGGFVVLKQLKGENGIRINTMRSCHSDVNLAYVRRITKAASLSDTVEVRIHDGEPIGFVYRFKGAELKFYLAPAM